MSQDVDKPKGLGKLIKSGFASVKESVLGSFQSLRATSRKELEQDAPLVHLQVGTQLWPNVGRELRTELWLSCLHRTGNTVGHNFVVKFQSYSEQEITAEAALDIDKDLRRTFPNTQRFSTVEGQQSLRLVLRAYAAHDPEVAYCQGMNFLAGLLLMYMPSEAHAFAALVVLMEERGLRRFYGATMSLLQVQLWQLSKLMPPKLNEHMEACGVVPVLFASGWLMTAFSADFPTAFSARIMDVMLADRCDFALLKVAATLLRHCERKLRSLHDLEDLLTYLKMDVPAWDEDSLHMVLSAAFSKPWTPRQLSILNSTDGVESVAQAMERVAQTNEANPFTEANADGDANDQEAIDMLGNSSMRFNRTVADASHRSGGLLSSGGASSDLLSPTFASPRDPTFLPLAMGGIPLLRPPPSYNTPGGGMTPVTGFGTAEGSPLSTPLSTENSMTVHEGGRDLTGHGSLSSTQPGMALWHGPQRRSAERKQACGSSGGGKEIGTVPTSAVHVHAHAHVNAPAAAAEVTSSLLRLSSKAAALHQQQQSSLAYAVPTELSLTLQEFQRLHSHVLSHAHPSSPHHSPHASPRHSTRMTHSEEQFLPYAAEGASSLSTAALRASDSLPNSAGQANAHGSCSGTASCSAGGGCSFRRSSVLAAAAAAAAAEAAAAAAAGGGHLGRGGSVNSQVLEEQEWGDFAQAALSARRHTLSRSVPGSFGMRHSSSEAADIGSLAGIEEMAAEAEAEAAAAWALGEEEVGAAGIPPVVGSLQGRDRVGSGVGLSFVLTDGPQLAAQGGVGGPTSPMASGTHRLASCSSVFDSSEHALVHVGSFSCSQLGAGRYSHGQATSEGFEHTQAAPQAPPAAASTAPTYDEIPPMTAEILAAEVRLEEAAEAALQRAGYSGLATEAAGMSEPFLDDDGNSLPSSCYSSMRAPYRGAGLAAVVEAATAAAAAAGRRSSCGGSSGGARGVQQQSASGAASPSASSFAKVASDADEATDAAADILRMMGLVDNTKVLAGYDPKGKLAEAMYADSPDKERAALCADSSPHATPGKPPPILFSEMRLSASSSLGGDLSNGYLVVDATTLEARESSMTSAAGGTPQASEQVNLSCPAARLSMGNAPSSSNGPGPRSSCHGSNGGSAPGFNGAGGHAADAATGTARRWQDGSSISGRALSTGSGMTGTSTGQALLQGADSTKSDGWTGVSISEGGGSFNHGTASGFGAVATAAAAAAHAAGEQHLMRMLSARSSSGGGIGGFSGDTAHVFAQASGAAAAAAMSSGGTNGTCTAASLLADDADVEYEAALMAEPDPLPTPAEPIMMTLRRPAFYVDGIPMLDVSAIMQEAQVEAAVMLTMPSPHQLQSPGGRALRTSWSAVEDRSSSHNTSNTPFSFATPLTPLGTTPHSVGGVVRRSSIDGRSSASKPWAGLAEVQQPTPELQTKLCSSYLPPRSPSSSGARHVSADGGSPHTTLPPSTKLCSSYQPTGRSSQHPPSEPPSSPLERTLSDSSDANTVNDRTSAASGFSDSGPEASLALASFSILAGRIAIPGQSSNNSSSGQTSFSAAGSRSGPSLSRESFSVLASRPPLPSLAQRCSASQAAGAPGNRERQSPPVGGRTLHAASMQLAEFLVEEQPEWQQAVSDPEQRDGDSDMGLTDQQLEQKSTAEAQLENSKLGVQGGGGEFKAKYATDLQHLLSLAQHEGM